MHVVDAPRARAVVRMHGNCAIRENGSTCYRKQYPPPPLHFSILAAARKLFRPFSLFLVFMAGIVASPGNPVQLAKPQPIYDAPGSFP